MFRQIHVLSAGLELASPTRERNSYTSDSNERCQTGPKSGGYDFDSNFYKEKNGQTCQTDATAVLRTVIAQQNGYASILASYISHDLQIFSALKYV